MSTNRFKGREDCVRRLLQNPDFQLVFDTVCETYMSRFGKVSLHPNNQSEAIRLLSEFQGHMNFRDGLRRVLKAKQKADERAERKESLGDRDV